MTTGVLLVTHQGIGSTMLQVARQIMNATFDHIDYLEVGFDADTVELTRALEDKLSRVEQGAGVLVLSDLIGATPCNLASNSAHQNTIVVTGLNLPMLIRVYNYRERPLHELSRIAQEGAQKGIFQLSHDNCINTKEL
ncbi:MAG: PTS fructose IIA subunit family protein [Gammaproteobacteria bacterium]|nr:PTS fructose IIA subunit family protein [Gammaproteobacteria bacterium]NNJ91541.1 PTS fructose IIA subunit family protein [Gammaproteobacteria bacterium]